MGTPGFAAEASLYRSRQPYRGYGGTAGDGGAGSVIPAQLCGVDCMLGCVGAGVGCLAPCLWDLAESCLTPPLFECDFTKFILCAGANCG